MALLIFLSVSSVTSSYAKDWAYTVRPNDTLWDLCLTYTTQKNCWLTIGEYNGVSYPPSLAPGTRIKFPVGWLKVQPVPAVIMFVVGEVQLTLPSGELKPAQIDDKLTMGAEVKVSSQSSVTLKFADGALLVVEENSHIVMDTLTQHQGTGMVNTQLNLLSGAAKSRVPKRQPRSNFSVSTPSAIAAVRGTEFRVSTSEGQMQGEVFEGLVNIAKPHNASLAARKNNTVLQAVDVEKQYGLSVKKNEVLGSPIALLPAVTWVTAINDVHLPYTLLWNAQPKASRYKVELLVSDKTEEVISSHYQVGHTWLLPIEQNQCFTVRVSAIDAFNLQGMPAVRHLCAAKPLAAIKQLALNDNQLQWPSIEHANMYRIEGSVDSDFSSPILIDYTCQTTYQLTDEEKGLYIRVIAVDEQGRIGLAGTQVQVKQAGPQGMIATILFMLMLAL
ncbi:FecR family protein [Marinagarivorans algicola]|uniref:FecR family protein n=1 Tax=Marinagarivorans algicola TaxID=1513270 RepID=UPI0012E0E9BE|nr:FecR domain-containing protein [Marinagarivorans algicola]